MEEQNNNSSVPFCPYLSVDCVLLGINDDKLCVLLVEREKLDKQKAYKLPGSLIYETEELDDAALRVMRKAMGGNSDVPFIQFRTYGSMKRTANIEDVKWLEHESHTKVSRIVTVVYLALSKNGKPAAHTRKQQGLAWVPVTELPDLPFDHKTIIDEAVKEIRDWVEKDPAILFDYLPVRFTAYQLRRTHEIIYDKKLDVRNFQKKMNLLGYVIPTDEIEVGVAHRAARYYRFDKVKYKQMRSSLNK